MRSPVDTLRRLVLAFVGLTLPFENTAISSIAIQVTPNKLVTALLLAVVMLQLAAERRDLPRDPKRLWVAFFGVALGVGALQSVLAGVAIDGVRRILTTAYSLLLFYFMLTYAMRRRDELDLLLRWFAVGSVAAVLSGWLGFGVQIEGVRGSRLAGEGSSPNLLAFNLIVAIAGAAALYFSVRRLASRLAYLGLIAVMTAGVVATLSRSAYVALLAMSLLWALRFGRIGFIKYAAPGLLLAVAAALLAPEQAVERAATLAPAGIQEDESSLGRLRMFPETYRAFMSNPLTGVGLGGYIAWAAKHEEDPGGIHSAFLQVLAENGLLGFVPFVAITMLAWREFTQASRLARRAGARRDDELRLLQIRALLLQIGYAGALVMSLAQPSMHHKVLWLLFALSTCVLGLVRERARALGASAENSPLGWDPGFVAQQRLGPRLDARAR